jgi:hypothetical protein
MVENSTNAETMDPGLTPEFVRQITELSDDDIVDALDELESRGFVRKLSSLSSGVLGFHLLGPEPALFAKFENTLKTGIRMPMRSESLQIS